MNPSVSVVIPCFNLGSYLDDAVQSVLDQSYEDFEIVIVDDGSDDPATSQLLASYRRPKTRIIRTENQGLASARNTGLEAAAGRYVSFLDADDLFETTFLERTVALLDAEPQVAFASCWLTAFGAREFDWSPRDCSFPWLLAEDTVCTAALTRRDPLVAVGGYDTSPWLAGWEDWDVAIALVNSGFAGQIIPERLFRYRIRPGSMTSRINEPEYHGRVYAGLLDKYHHAYSDEATGVAAAILARISELEADLPADPPPRPDAEVNGANWKTSLLALESHRRLLEAELEAPAPAPESPPRPLPVEWGTLRRTVPVSRVWGLDRGQPIDRHYIERFLQDNAATIVGDVMEIKDPFYTQQFHAGATSVTVLDIAEQNPRATVRADLSANDPLPVTNVHCAIVTQTIHLVFEQKQLIKNLWRSLAPGGVVLATLPCVSRIDYEAGVSADYWRYTAASAHRLFAARFGEDNVDVVSFGNLLACTAFLQGLAFEDLTREELDHSDPYFPLLIGVRARRAPEAERKGTRSAAPTREVNGRVEHAGCRSISGWAWNPNAAHHRVRLEVWSGGERLGEVWADQFRDDLAKAGIGSGQHAFTFNPPRKLHHDGPLEVEVRCPGSDAQLPGSPTTVTCDCSIESDVLGYAIDTPEDPSAPPFPWITVSGWVLGRDGPVDYVALSHRGQRFQTIPVRGVRPDLADLYPQTPWALRAGFSSRVSLVGVSGPAEITIEAVLADGAQYTLGEIHGTTPSPADAVTVLACGWPRQDGPESVLSQSVPVRRVLVADQRRTPNHPGCARIHNLSQACDDRAGFLWVCSGREGVTDDFAVRAEAALAADPLAAFAVAVAPGVEVPTTLSSVVGGTGIGVGLMFRTAAVITVGGLDEGADGAEALQWDLAIRLAQAGHEWVHVAAAEADAQPIAIRANEDVIRWLYRKHAGLYSEHLAEILVERERTIGALLAMNHLAERELEEELRPRLRARRRERDRLGAKLRSAGEAKQRAPAGARAWGELARVEPFSEASDRPFGFGVDRRYVEDFLERHAPDVHGCVLVYASDAYARRYGGSEVEQVDVLDLRPGNPNATVVADLRNPAALPADAYDCVVVPQLLRHVSDPRAALAACHRMLKPGGVLLTTVTTVGSIKAESPDDDRWRFSSAALRQLLETVFEPAHVEVLSEGNRSSAAALLLGLPAADADQPSGTTAGPGAELVSTGRAVKPGGVADGS